MKVLGIIPARIGSKRLKRKVLLDIGGKTMLQRTYEQAKKAKQLDAIVIATDSKKIADTAQSFGAHVIMTPKTITSGSDRVAVAAKKFKKFKPDIVVNIQGDEPLMPPAAINKSVQALKKDKKAIAATPATPFKEKKEISNPGCVKVVLDTNNNALYFSRSVIPHPRDRFTNYLKHLGLYVFRYDFLLRYTKMKQTPLEKTEKLEQLRILENGYTIKVVKGTFNTIEINTAAELKKVRDLFK